MSKAADVEVPASGQPAERAGERVVRLLAIPLNVSVLRALSERPMRLGELRQAAGLPAQTTLRAHLAGLAEIGALGRRKPDETPSGVETELTPTGADLLAVADRIEAWLALAPEGPIALDGAAARGILKAFVDGWGSTMTSALAVRPRSLTALDRSIEELSYPALERRLSSMRIAGLIEADPTPAAGTPYTLTEWGRRGILPLAAAAGFEARHFAATAPPVRSTDVEAAFLLTLPLVRLEPKLAGTCQLEVELGTAAAGVRVTVERGRVASCERELRAGPGGYAAGSAESWFAAIVDGAVSQLRFGGVPRLSEAIVSGLHSALVAR